MIRVLFVCLGNICRSPLAEAIFKNKIDQLGMSDQFFSDSAGTSAFHVGDRPDHRTIHVANAHTIPIDHNCTEFTRSLGESFDYIIAMDSSNYRNVIALMGRQTEGLFLMRHFDSLLKNSDVPDPYYGGLDDFENVYEILNRSIDTFIEYLIKNHRLISS